MAVLFWFLIAWSAPYYYYFVSFGRYGTGLTSVETGRKRMDLNLLFRYMLIHTSDISHREINSVFPGFPMPRISCYSAPSVKLPGTGAQRSTPQPKHYSMHVLLHHARSAIVI